MKLLDKEIEILIKERCNNWEEAIDKVSLPLLKKNKITSQYISVMKKFNIDYNAYFVIAKGVALVHARPENGVIEPGISIMTLEKPVNFGNAENDPVSIVFCIASISKSDHIDILKFIMKLLDDENKLHYMLNVKNKNEMKKIFN
ncbi:PTS sugar transporter subunit IIA [Oceanivirga salmonicida]|uniref:PTS sugar transporter subunit IIA n=1 Tax=Oceanivirga salmonicida TaxID=1769291 RepID=UPI000830E9FB|nr:PTS sugar transporter subunit IIA [Oceanivirga salmonicida]